MHRKDSAPTGENQGRPLVQGVGRIGPDDAAQGAGVNIERYCGQVKAGAITFDAFAKMVAPWVHGFARKAQRRMRLPAAVMETDIEQEFLTQAWIALDEYDASRGIPIGKYVAVAAYLNTNVWLHRQRGAERRDCRSPSRSPVAFSQYFRSEPAGDQTWYEALESSMRDDADQHDAYVAKERLSLLLNELSPDDLDILKCLVAHAGDARHLARTITPQRSVRLRTRARQVLTLSSLIVERTETNAAGNDRQ